MHFVYPLDCQSVKSPIRFLTFFISTAHRERRKKINQSSKNSGDKSASLREKTKLDFLCPPAQRAARFTKIQTSSVLFGERGWVFVYAYCRRRKDKSTAWSTHRPACAWVVWCTVLSLLLETVNYRLCCSGCGPS